jgi:hypothetical protein
MREILRGHCTHDGDSSGNGKRQGAVHSVSHHSTTRDPAKRKHRCVDFVKLKFLHEYAAFMPRGAVSRQGERAVTHLPQLKIESTKN